jgi:5-methylcytosine-specific restriction endonuclease McrA
MDRRTKTKLNRDKAARLKAAWGVNAIQVRYRETGDWYSALARFPAALFDINGYVLFATEEAYRTSPYLQIGKQISVPNGISTMPDYVRVIDSNAQSGFDVDIHTFAATEGQARLVLHLQRERNQTVVRNKKKQATSLDCEICGFSFSCYGSAASDYCEVHHLVPLSEVEHSILTRMEDLAILCANCHRVVHLRNPPYNLNEVKGMLAKK